MAALLFFFLKPPPRISSQELKIVRSTERGVDAVPARCFVLEKMENLDGDLNVLGEAVAPPRTTEDVTDDVESLIVEW